MSVDGTWNIKMETPMGTRTAVLNLKSDGSELTGTFGGDGGSTDIYDGTVNDNTASWKINIVQPMALTFEFSVTFAEDTFTGSVKLGMFGNSPVTGVRA